MDAAYLEKNRKPGTHIAKTAEATYSPAAFQSEFFNLNFVPQ
jgi:hypothetical protein